MTDVPGPGRLGLVSLAVLVEGGLVLLAGGLGWLVGHPVWDHLWWDAGDAAWGAAATLPMLGLLAACLTVPLPGLRRLRRLCADILVPLFAPCSLAELALISLLAGLGEESLFRGVVQPALADALGLAAALLLTSLLFALLHALTATYALLALGIGLYLGLVSVAAGNVLVVAVAHGGYDFVALAYLTRGPGVRPNRPASGGREETLT